VLLPQIMMLYMVVPGCLYGRNNPALFEPTWRNECATRYPTVDTATGRCIHARSPPPLQHQSQTHVKTQQINTAQNLQPFSAAGEVIHKIKKVVITSIIRTPKKHKNSAPASTHIAKNQPKNNQNNSYPSSCHFTPLPCLRTPPSVFHS
jgi:hypothetical protein